MYQYKILLNHMHDCAHEMRLTLEKATEVVGEPKHRSELLAAEDALKTAYERLASERMQRMIERQIRLADDLIPNLELRD